MYHITVKQDRGVMQSYPFAKFEDAVFYYKQHIATVLGNTTANAGETKVHIRLYNEDYLFHETIMKRL